MKIKHIPIFDTDQVCIEMTKRDNVAIKYVCTTSNPHTEHEIDVFYRSTPHPKFGNRYFGLHIRSGMMMISNADWVENLNFALVENDTNELEYSQYRHDYKKFDNGNMIDGGRDYVRWSGKTPITHKVSDGEMIPSNTQIKE